MFSHSCLFFLPQRLLRAVRLHVVVMSPSICSHFSLFPCFSWPWNFERIRYFVKFDWYWIASVHQAWENLTSLQQLIFLSMNMVYFSIHPCLLWLLSSVFYTFYQTDPAQILLNLYLCFLFFFFFFVFGARVNGGGFFFPQIPVVHCWYTGI